MQIIQNKDHWVFRILHLKKKCFGCPFREMASHFWRKVTEFKFFFSLTKKTFFNKTLVSKRCENILLVPLLLRHFSFSLFNSHYMQNLFSYCTLCFSCPMGEILLIPPPTHLHLDWEILEWPQAGKLTRLLYKHSSGFGIHMEYDECSFFTLHKTYELA